MERIETACIKGPDVNDDPVQVRSKMKRFKSRCVVFPLVLLAWVLCCRADEPVVAWWKFDSVRDNKTVESVTGREYEIVGNFKLVEGVCGRAVKLDGLTSYVTSSSDAGFRLGDEFTIEAWVALGAYPLNWCPVFSQYAGGKGVYLGVGDKGQVGLCAGVGSDVRQLTTETTLELRKWYHIAGVVDSGNHMAVYINGKAAGESGIDSRFRAAPSAEVLLGKYFQRVKPTGGIRKDSHMVTDILFDGIIDEVKVTAKALDADQIAASFAKNRPGKAPDIARRILPAGPKGNVPFGAFYTRLKYYDEWDALWRVSDCPDVVVAFGRAPYRFVFWRGTSYIPHWVTANGIWYDNEFCETWGGDVAGCAEPMSDKQCRHSHVRIIENSDARVVVHWRYALVDNHYKFARVDKLTGWGDWTDEIYTIYPDGVGIRRITLHSTNPEAPHEWQEGIIVMGPGWRPEDALWPEALTLANMDGESRSYSWANGPPKLRDKPANANIHLVNTRSKYKPFVVIRPQDEPRFGRYGGEIRPNVSIFPWWNHWPTSQNPSDGRYAMAADRAAHSSLTHIEWKEYCKTPHSMTKIMLHGMTDKPAGELAMLARSWSYPAKLKVTEGNYTSCGYDQSQRAFVVKSAQPGVASQLVMELQASAQSPLVNPAFLIEGWGRAGCIVKLGRKRLLRGSQLRYGHRRRLDGTDLVVWVQIEATEPVEVTVVPTPNQVPVRSE